MTRLRRLRAEQGVGLAELARLNGLSEEDTIRRGRTLKLPDQTPALVASAEVVGTPVEQVAAVTPVAPSVDTRERRRRQGDQREYRGIQSGREGSARASARTRHRFRGAGRRPLAGAGWSSGAAVGRSGRLRGGRRRQRQRRSRRNPGTFRGLAVAARDEAARAQLPEGGQRSLDGPQRSSSISRK